MWRRAGAVGDLRDRAARHAEARRRHGEARPPVRWLARTLGGGLCRGDGSLLAVRGRGAFPVFVSWCTVFLQKLKYEIYLFLLSDLAN
jgi:hypothetical protein